MLCDSYRSGRFPHAILFAGPRGIGKATLAFRLARYLLADKSAQDPGEGLAIPPESGVFRRVAAGSHGDLLTIERSFDPRRGRLRSEIGVEEARQTALFLRLTAAEGGARIVIIDGAEEMTRNAQNALLKILEEPPPSAYLLLLSHSPGRLLPTIRSRAWRIPLAPLSEELVANLIGRYRPQTQEKERAALALLSQGSIGRALDLAEAGGLRLYRELLALLGATPAIDLRALHAFADALTRAGEEESYRVVEELILDLLARIATLSAKGREDEEILDGEGVLAALAAKKEAGVWASLRAGIEEGFARARALNLDKKQAILAALFAIEERAG